ncbi:MAG TPA: hypothetical protein VK946_01315 [Methylotenera sp.]|nr:hypothetical protein [Methylotenera sp.]
MSIPYKNYLVIFLTFSTNTAFAQSHCSNGEIDYFSCQIKGGHKVASLCGAKQEIDSSSNEWVQYRYGKIGKPELIYPLTKLNSAKKFENNYFNPHGIDAGVIDVRFINEKTLYSVSMSNRSNNHGKTYISDAYVSFDNNKKSITLNCSKVKKSYWDSLYNMPSNRGMNTNFLDDFYKIHAK